MKDEATILIQAHLDGELTDRQRRRLTAWLGESRANVERFVRECRLHSELFDLHCRAKDAAWGEQRVPRSVPAAPCDGRSGDGGTHPSSHPASAPPIHASSFILHPSLLLGSVPLAYAAVVLILGAGLLAARGWRSGAVDAASGRAIEGQDAASTAPAGPLCVARITGLSHCQWVGPNTTARQGEAVALGRKFALHSGFLGITYESGARLLLAGPAVYEVDAINGGTLYLGKVGITIPEKTTGAGEPGKEVHAKSIDPTLDVRRQRLFCLCTPSSKMIAQTAGEFRVTVNDSGASSLYVLEGRAVSGGRRRAVEVFHFKEDRSEATIVFGAGEKGHFFPSAERQGGRKSFSGT